MDAAELAFAGIARQAELIRAGDISSRELVDLYLERIERLDPLMNSLPHRLRRAGPRGGRRGRSARRRGRECAVARRPIALKDEVDVEGELTTHGTAGFDRPATPTRPTTGKLREAGAILIGKTTLSELAIWPFTETEALGRDPQPLGPHADLRRVERRLRRGRRGGPRRRGLRLRRGRVDPHPRRLQRALRAEAAARQDQPRAGARALARPLGHRLLTRRVADTALWLDSDRRSGAGRRRHPAAARRPLRRGRRRSPGKLRVA